MAMLNRKHLATAALAGGIIALGAGSASAAMADTQTDTDSSVAVSTQQAGNGNSSQSGQKQDKGLASQIDTAKFAKALGISEAKAKAALKQVESKKPDQKQGSDDQQKPTSGATQGSDAKPSSDSTKQAGDKKGSKPKAGTDPFVSDLAKALNMEEAKVKSALEAAGWTSPGAKHDDEKSDSKGSNDSSSSDQSTSQATQLSN